MKFVILQIKYFKLKSLCTRDFQYEIIVIYLTSSCVIWAWSTNAKKAQITQERVEYNVFLFKGFRWLKIFKISLTFRFDKLSNSSKSVHTGENSQILTVSNKNSYLLYKTIKFYFIFESGLSLEA
jgi:hypothetical protein